MRVIGLPLYVKTNVGLIPRRASTTDLAIRLSTTRRSSPFLTNARVLAVRSLARALIAIEAEVPSAVILDHALSDGESSQLRERLKERNIPCVLHSGYSAREHDGAADDKVVCVPKPASPQHLVATVEGLLRSRQNASGARSLA
jgi:DNA-binding response OmpR family regulator